MSNSKKYPSPIKTKEFARYWEIYLPLVTRRANFSVGHLEQLKILCQLFCTQDELSATIAKVGLTYETEGGRNGDLIKPRPELIILKETRTQINMFCRLLGLHLTKDEAFSEEDVKNKDDWG